LDDSTMVIPTFNKLEAVKQQLGLTTATGYFNVLYSGSGSGAVIHIAMSNGNAYAISQFVTQGGSGYQVGETIRVYGLSLGGVTPTNDAIITIKNTGKKGAMTDISISGTAGSTPGSIDLQLAGGTNALIVLDQEARLNGFKLASNGNLLDPNDFALGFAL